MINLPAIAIGPIIAAAIAAVLSFVGLVITKEQKTSEFRQAWIDGLREEIKDYLSTVTLISDLELVKHDSLEKRVIFLKDYYHQLNKSTYAISLRINPKEIEAESLIEKMLQLKIGIDQGQTGAEFQEIEREFLEQAQIVLKKEWRRVKRGEITFVATKFMMILLAGLVLVAVLLAIIRPAQSLQNPVTMNQRAPTIANPLPAKKPNTSSSKDRHSHELKGISRGSAVQAR